MPDAFDMLGEAVTTDKGTIYDYPASPGEAFVGGVERALDTNPLALAARALRSFDEGFRAQFDPNSDQHVDQKTALEEIRSRGLDIKVGLGGISRYELDTLQYLKQREVRQNTVAARADGVLGVAAGFAGGFAGSFTDPINIASNFIPFVSEYRYARWLAQAGTSTAARAAVRVGAGAIEGAAGAAVLEPLIYAGATSLQLDYDSTDSFLNVTIGGAMGGGLHTIGGAVYDARVSKALRGLDKGIVGNTAIRDALAALPEMQKRELFQASVAAMERGEVFDVEPVAAREAEKALTMQQASNGEGFVVTNGLGHVVAEISGKLSEDGKVYQISMVQSPTLERGSVGAGNVRQILRMLQGALPGVERIEGERVTGAKVGGLGWGESTGAGLPVAIEGGKVKAATGKALPPVRLSDQRVIDDEGFRPGLVEEFRSKFAAAKTPDDLAFVERDLAQYPSYSQGRIRDALGVRSASTPRDLGGLIQQSRADRTQEAFNRQFVNDAEATIAQEKARPKDKIEAVKQDETEFRDVVEEFRGAGLTTADDDARLKQADELASWADRRAKAFEAAAGCMETT